MLLALPMLLLARSERRHLSIEDINWADERLCLGSEGINARFERRTATVE